MLRLVKVAASMALLMTATVSLAAPRAAPKAKPKAKPKPSATRPVKGTVQLPGDNGQMGVTYTMGKGDNPLNFTLLSAEYTVARAAFSSPVYPTADEKLLVLHYMVQNPNPRETELNWHSFKFTAVDSENINREGGQESGVVKPETGEVYFLRLKPAQKVNAVGVITVPARNSVPKLMVEREGPVLRYHFTGSRENAKNVIKGLPAPFADPADPAGVVARTEVPAEKGAYYPLGAYDLMLAGTGFEAGTIGEVTPGDSERIFVATITFKNAMKAAQGQTWHTFTGELRTDDGEKAKSEGLYKLKRDESIYGDQAPGEEYSARLLFRIPKNAAPDKLSIWEGESRRIVLDVSEAK